MICHLWTALWGLRLNYPHLENENIAELIHYFCGIIEKNKVVICIIIDLRVCNETEEIFLQNNIMFGRNGISNINYACYLM